MSASGLRRRPVTLVWLSHAALSVVDIHTFYGVPVADSKSLVAFRVIATGSVAYRLASFQTGTSFGASSHVARAMPDRSYHFVVAVCRTKEHNPSRKLLEYYR